MNVLFMSLGTFYNLNSSSVHLDILKRLSKDNNVWLVCKNEDRPTELSEELGIHVLRVHTGELKRVGLIQKGINTIKVEPQFKRAIKKYLSNVKFDLVLYTTPPITFASAVKYVKKRDGAKTYLMLKDIFPQNAVDLGMMSTTGIKGILYKYFRNKEKELYSLSDRIGCMSPANVRYILDHNPEIPPNKVEICPNAVEIIDKRISPDKKIEMRQKYGLPMDKKVFVYGGNLGKPQGIPFLIKCLRAEKENDKAFFLIVGDGTEYDLLENFVNTEKLQNARLMKSLLKEDYDDLVAACDVGMIFLDHRFTIPNFPSRLLSYMQAGLPVLACTDPNTDIGKVVSEGDLGWWCESDDVKAFTEIVNAVVNADTAEQKRNAVKYLIDHYSVETAYDRIIESVVY